MFAAVALLLVLAGFPLKVTASGSDALKIGVLLPPEEPQLQSVREGILLAEEHANQSSNGPVRVSIRGRVGQWGADAVEAARLVAEDGAAGLIAPPDGAASHLVLQVSGRTAVPVMTLCADSSVGYTGVPWLLRMVPRTQDEATALFKGVFPTNESRGRRWVALVPDQRAGREIGGDLRKAALACDCILDPVLELGSQTNADAIIARALASRPEGIFLWLAPQSAADAARKLRGSGYVGPLTGPGRLQTAGFFTRAGSAAEGFTIPALARGREEMVRLKSFEAAYHEHWGRDPDVIAAISYDAAMVLIHLARQDAFQNPPHRLPSGFCWPGVSGDVSFDSEGNRKARFELLRVSGGRFMVADRSN
ncbi:MAG TPA: ABC transporter substrate-binding protein [Verrucomicrobiae bacterium]|nr:ABC transporter substrate-binding protein [Verrucomicrobiae bacterium]